MNEVAYHIGILTVDLHIPAAQSLKQKRMVLKSIKDRARAKFNVSMAEIGGQDKWQVATLGFTMINNDQRYIDGCLQNLLSFIDSFHSAEICDHCIEFL